jgi:hypothetical protein
MDTPNLDASQTKVLAKVALGVAKRMMPKLTGKGASSLRPVCGPGWFGIEWDSPYIWYQEAGIKAFTMSSLAGKIIPLWIDDPTGKERSSNPKAKVRTTASGKIQVLIFRRAATVGSRKVVKRRVNGMTTSVSTVASYPGAPGRIGNRETSRPNTRMGKVGGRIAAPNVGVRWRHPGLAYRVFLHQSLVTACENSGVSVGGITAFDSLGRVA